MKAWSCNLYFDMIHETIASSTGGCDLMSTHSTSLFSSSVPVMYTEKHCDIQERNTIIRRSNARMAKL